MKESTNLLLIGIVFVSILLVMLQIYVNQTPMEQRITERRVETQSIKVVDYYPALDDYYFIESLAETNSAYREYKLDVYDCTQFSERLVKILRENGYKAQCTAGHTPNWDYKDHTWVSVWIGEHRFEVEATGGFIIDDEDYKENYVKVWENKCW